jgi:hypothetical protein
LVSLAIVFPMPRLRLTYALDARIDLYSEANKVPPVTASTIAA